MHPSHFSQPFGSLGFTTILRNAIVAYCYHFTFVHLSPPPRAVIAFTIYLVTHIVLHGAEIVLGSLSIGRYRN